VHYVVFHEDAFPEQVSAYPVVLTLRRLLNHPRLALLEQGGSVWAFRIRARPGPVSGLLPDGPYFPCYRWNAAACPMADGTAVEDATAWGGAYASLKEGGVLSVPRPFNHMYAPDPRLWIRARGRGVCRFVRIPDDPEPVTHRLESDDWEWIAVPLPSEQERMHFSAEVIEGAVDLDMLMQAAGGWRPPDFGETVSFPGCLFFRSGYTDAANNSVTLRPDYDAASRVFYGLRLPLKLAGTYAVKLVFTSDAPPETRLGEFTMSDGRTVSQPVDVVAGLPAEFVWQRLDNLPLDFDFTYTRNGSITIHAVELTLRDEL
jgi:hypothetical protein